MAAYRLFFFDAKGHIRSAVVIDCDGDEAAVAHADEQCDGREMELWLRDRLVRSFPADPARTPRPPAR